MFESMLTPDSVIDALGGTKAVADALSLSKPAVSVWRWRGIPSKRLPSLSKLASQRGLPEINLESLSKMVEEADEARA